VGVGLTERGNNVSVQAVGVCLLTFDEGESLMQGIKVYTLIVGSRGLIDFIKYFVVVVIV
jgi:hypothetical protein